MKCDECLGDDPVENFVLTVSCSYVASVIIITSVVPNRVIIVLLH